MRDPLTWRDWPAVALLVLLICFLGLCAFVLIPRIVFAVFA